MILRRWIRKILPLPTPAMRLLRMATGSWASQAISAAAKLGLADLLRDGPRHVDELAELTGTHGASLYRLMRALATLGIFAEQEDRSFALTPLAQPLRSDVRDSVRNGAILMGESFYRRAWDGLEHAVRTGEAAFEHVHGQRLFDLLSQDSDARRLFQGWMNEVSELNLPTILAAYDFRAFHKVVDVGGGEGRLLGGILKEYPALRGVLYELPRVVEENRYIEETGLTGRCEVVAGDFFESIPSGGDAYLLKIILHDWSDELAVRILENCREAMSERGKLLIMESVVPPGGRPHYSKLLDLEMLILNHGGYERTEKQFRRLLDRAGFQLERILGTSSPLTILEAVRT